MLITNYWANKKYQANTEFISVTHAHTKYKPFSAWSFLASVTLSTEFSIYRLVAKLCAKGSVLTETENQGDSGKLIYV